MMLKQILTFEIDYNGKKFSLQCPVDASYADATGACLEMMMQIKVREKAILDQQAAQKAKEENKPQECTSPEPFSEKEVATIEEAKPDMPQGGDHAA